jgi:hypothetical protein
MNDELAMRLRKMGVMKGVRHLRPASPLEGKVRPHPSRLNGGFAFPGSADVDDDGGPVLLEQLLPGGRMEETAEGTFFVVDRVYPLSYQHGQDRLSDLLRFQPAAALSFMRDDRLAALDFRDFVFLDTETTGLAGASVLAFMVGVAFFAGTGENDALVVRQYFSW